MVSLSMYAAFRSLFRWAMRQLQLCIETCGQLAACMHMAVHALQQLAHVCVPRCFRRSFSLGGETFEVHSSATLADLLRPSWTDVCCILAQLQLQAMGRLCILHTGAACKAAGHTPWRF